MKKYLSSIALLVVLVPVVASAKIVISEWQFVKSIQVPAVSAPTYVSVALDKDVSAVGDLRDIRVVDTGGNEIPYQLITAQYALPTSKISQILNNGSDASGRTSFVVDLGSSGTIHNQLTIDTLSSNYRRQVSIYSSDVLRVENSSGWKLLTDKGYIYKFSDTNVGVAVGGNTVSYPSTTSRYLKVVVGPGAEGPVSVVNANVIKQETAELVSQSLSVSGTVMSDEKNNSTVLTFDLGSAGVFTTSITLTASDPNFSRRVVVESSDDNVRWDYVTQGYISHLTTSIFNGGSSVISYPETKARYVRATVFNQNDKPLSFATTAHFLSPVRYFVFEIAPSISYSLYYGNPRAQSPQYDLSRIFQYLELNNFEKGTLGAQSANASYVPPPPPTVPFTEKNKHLLNTLLVLLVILTAVMIFFYLRKTVFKNNRSDDVPPPDEPKKPSNFVTRY